MWIDGHPVGALTDLMSKRHAPRLASLAEAGFSLDVNASLSRGAKKIEAFVYVPMSPLDAYDA
ncbi:MAG: hypothetical protein GEV08_00855 [Acidimicrobiia bacterium]|nr:hypothetical protein [Acidimicrobiia bacterium]